MRERQWLWSAASAASWYLIVSRTYWVASCGRGGRVSGADDWLDAGTKPAIAKNRIKTTRQHNLRELISAYKSGYYLDATKPAGSCILYLEGASGWHKE